MYSVSGGAITSLQGRETFLGNCRAWGCQPHLNKCWILCCSKPSPSVATHAYCCCLGTFPAAVLGTDRVLSPSSSWSDACHRWAGNSVLAAITVPAATETPGDVEGAPLLPYSSPLALCGQDSAKAKPAVSPGLLCVLGCWLGCHPREQSHLVLGRTRGVTVVPVHTIVPKMETHLLI